jgi:ABC-type transporter Mla subunit MlaD
MKRIFLFIVSLVFLFGCKESFKVQVKFDKIDGLDEKSEVIFNGLNVGEIEEISVDSDYNILVSLELSEIENLPKDSKFIIKPSIIPINKAIYIETGKSDTFLKNNETVIGYFEEKSLVDTLVNKGVKIMEEIAKEAQESNDSLNKKIQNQN